MQNPPNPDGFNALVWRIVQQIPAGQVSTYGQIASMLPAPAGVSDDEAERFGPVWVGKAMNAVSGREDTPIPWQRVINSQGGISLPEGSQAALEQRRRLLAEGVRFDGKGRVDLDAFGWEGPPAAWLRENSLRTPRSLRREKPNSGQLSLW